MSGRGLGGPGVASAEPRRAGPAGCGARRAAGRETGPADPPSRRVRAGLGQGARTRDPRVSGLLGIAPAGDSSPRRVAAPHLAHRQFGGSGVRKTQRDWWDFHFAEFKFGDLAGATGGTWGGGARSSLRAEGPRSDRVVVNSTPTKVGGELAPGFQKLGFPAMPRPSVRCGVVYTALGRWRGSGLIN